MSKCLVAGGCRVWPTVAAVALALFAATAARAEPRSIQSFVAVQSKWKQYVGTTWTLEGRYATLGSRELRFQNCDMRFLLDDDLVRARGLSNVIEVTGTLELQGAEVVFRISSSRARPSDAELVRLRRSTIDTSEPDDWYELAAWTRNRGKFYGDQSLLAEALELYQEAILAERRKLKPDDAKGRLALAAKARELGLGEPFVHLVEHDALRAQFQQMRDTKNADFTSLTTEIARKLPGALDRLAGEPGKLAGEYRQDPLATYRLADDEKRRLLNRLFYLEVLETRARQAASADGQNGYQIARQLEVDAPELKQLADSYREDHLQYQLARVATLTRQELIEFVRRCEAHGDQQLAARAKEGWLAAREPRLRQDGARGLVELGEDWMTMVGDEQKAARFFIDAYNANPGYAPASEWLTSHGYVYQRGHWLPSSKAEKMVDPKQLAIREGRVEPKMTPAEVRAALGTTPSATFRFASTGRISELWIFEQAGIMVRFEHHSGGTDGVVVSVDEVQPKPVRKPGGS